MKKYETGKSGKLLDAMRPRVCENDTEPGISAGLFVVGIWMCWGLELFLFGKGYLVGTESASHGKSRKNRVLKEHNDIPRSAGRKTRLMGEGCRHQNT